jgi:hypothetical protein
MPEEKALLAIFDAWNAANGFKYTAKYFHKGFILAANTMQVCESGNPSNFSNVTEWDILDSNGEEFWKIESESSVERAKLYVDDSEEFGSIYQMKEFLAKHAEIVKKQWYGQE